MAANFKSSCFLEFQKTLSLIFYTIQFTKGKECEENLTEEENCSLQSCPEVTNCQYSQWTTIEECIILFFFYYFTNFYAFLCKFSFKC